MYQATGVTNGCQRPAILHAYGGAKTGMAKSLASIAPEGWIPMAAAMLGTEDKPPMWASVGLRPVVGTTIDFGVLPPMLSEREELLMLSCWQQWDPTSVQGSALSQWRNNPWCTALIILKEGTRVPMSWPGALRDREENPGCPFTNQRPCQAKVQGILQTRTHQRRDSQP